MNPVSTEALYLFGRLEALLNGAFGDLSSMDAGARLKLSETTRRVNLATEAAGDTIHRVMLSPLQLPLALIGMETRLFEILAEQEGKAAKTAELASITKADPALIKRLLRYYQAFGMVDEPAEDQYLGNNITSALATPGGFAAIAFYSEAMIPALTVLPQFLRDTGYSNITDKANYPWYLGQKTNKQFFEWIEERPNVLNHFMSWMRSQRDGLPLFLGAIDFKEEFASHGVNEDTPVFVDIGGSFGHQCVRLRQKHPDLVGRVILQDREEVIQQAKTHPIPGFEGVIPQAHDFFTPQPIKGARAYYLRHVLHDWPDNECIDILKNIKSAMTQESRILIDEIVLPERGAHWRVTQLDIAMGGCFAGMERSRVEWEILLGKANLGILKVVKYGEQLGDCIIIAVPK
ncbi:S-adenosyl-L-methionine-dependent methyltransferase [Xylaria digitata]|nr:S-adenosyl-L-methionine-dependent methyltransferase [Xylaria digitata]